MAHNSRISLPLCSGNYCLYHLLGCFIYLWKTLKYCLIGSRTTESSAHYCMLQHESAFVKPLLCRTNNVHIHMHCSSNDGLGFCASCLDLNYQIQRWPFENHRFYPCPYLGNSIFPVFRDSWVYSGNNFEYAVSIARLLCDVKRVAKSLVSNALFVDHYWIWNLS